MLTRPLTLKSAQGAREEYKEEGFRPKRLLIELAFLQTLR